MYVLKDKIYICKTEKISFVIGRPDGDNLASRVIHSRLLNFSSDIISREVFMISLLNSFSI